MMEKGRPPGRTRRRFTEEFKADAVALVLDGGRPVAHVADDLGIGESSLGYWVRQARVDRGEKPGLATGERSELVRLRWSLPQRSGSGSLRTAAMLTSTLGATRSGGQS